MKENIKYLFFRYASGLQEVLPGREKCFAYAGYGIRPKGYPDREIVSS